MKAKEDNVLMEGAVSEKKDDHRMPSEEPIRLVSGHGRVRSGGEVEKESRAGGFLTSNAREKYLTFFLDQEEYGVEILKVQEIIGLLPITRVPKTPDFIKGVVNLRGRVIPVVDLRLKFSMPPANPTDETCVIILQMANLTWGVIVDRVSEVMNIPANKMVETPDFGENINTDYILGMGRCDNRVIILLDVEKIFRQNDRVKLYQAGDS